MVISQVSGLAENFSRFAQLSRLLTAGGRQSTHRQAPAVRGLPPADIQVKPTDFLDFADNSAALPLNIARLPSTNAQNGESLNASSSTRADPTTAAGQRRRHHIATTRHPRSAFFGQFQAFLPAISSASGSTLQ